MVPNGWETKRIEQIADVKGGKRIPKGYSLQLKDNGFPYIRVKDMSENGVDTSSILYVPTEIVESISKYTISANDVFITVAGALLGLVGKIPPTLENANLTENADKLTNLKINQDYLIAVLRSPIGKKLIEAEKTTNAQPKLALTRIRNFEIPVPPLLEQQKIAKILSTWDKAISTTERLIDNSSQQKKALMQQLLTGKKRLLDESGKQFSDKWKELKLENVFKLSSGDTKPKDVENEPTEEQKIPVFGGNNIMGYSANSNSEGDVILIGRVGEYCGVTRLIQEKCWITDNALFTKEFSDEFDRLFIVYLLQNFQLSRLRNKGGQPQISQKPIYTLKLKIPLLEEQQKIAIVLTNADKEIELLKQQLADLQQEKKALMQVLLTGKKRVVV